MDTGIKRLAAEIMKSVIVVVAVSTSSPRIACQSVVSKKWLRPFQSAFFKLPKFAFNFHALRDFERKCGNNKSVISYFRVYVSIDMLGYVRNN